VHILTKILIVAVTLLVVMLVPLVMVNASNEASFKGRYTQAMSAADAARAMQRAAESSRVEADAAFRLELQSLQSANATLRQEAQRASAEARARQADLVLQASTLEALKNDFKVLAATERANSDLSKQLLDEATRLRRSETDLQSRNVALAQQISDLRADRDALVAANQSLQEELSSERDKSRRAESTVSRYLAYIGPLPDASAAAFESVRRPADRRVTATVSAVHREAEGTVLAEINAGDRDGIREGWVMMVTSPQGDRYIANIRIIEVDVNRSVGVVELEDRVARSPGVQVGQFAVARPGE
jgi:FtsZ-binding cell division protein ZapB